MQELRPVTLVTLAQGAAGELFANALGDVLANMDDPNTDWKARRRVTLTFDFQNTDEDRRAAKVTVGCSSKLAGTKPVSTHVHFGMHEGRLAAGELPVNGDLFATPHGKPQAVPPAAAEAQAGGAAE